MEMAALLFGGIALLIGLTAAPVVVGYVWRRQWWVVPAVWLGAFVLTLSFVLVFDGPRIPIILATLSGAFAAGGAAFARLGKWGSVSGLLVSGLGAFVFGAIFLVDFVWRLSMGFM